jgi:hypothetical protein
MGFSLLPSLGVPSLALSSEAKTTEILSPGTALEKALMRAFLGCGYLDLRRT